MGFDYLNSEQNMSPAPMGSPAFFSTPSEFVGESDGEGMAYSMNQPGATFESSFNSQFNNSIGLLGAQDPLYNALQQPSTFTQSQYPSYPSFPSQPPNLTQQSFDPFAYTPSLQYGQNHPQPAPFPAPFPNPSETASEADDEKPKKPAKSKKGKGKVKIDESLNSDGGSGTGAPRVSASRY
jgi:hypothetical protein